MSKINDDTRRVRGIADVVVLDDIDVAALLAEFDRLRADAARYQFIRAGNVYIEPHESGEIYMATDTGKYYKDMRDLDMDLDAAINAPECGDDDAHL